MNQDIHEHAGGDTWRVRIHSPASGRVIGSGVLLDDRTVLTCAHVVAREAVALVDFPELVAGVRTPATALPEHWIAPHRERGDIALLTLDRPCADSAPAPLLRAAPSLGTRVEMCGYPESVNNGEGAAFQARVSRKFGERVQLTLEGGAHLPRHGCSGGPVMDMNTPSRVLGITVTGFHDDQAPEPLSLAYMIPVDTITKYLRKVSPGGRPGVPPGIASRASADQPVEVSYATRLAAWLRGENRSPVYVTEIVRDGIRDRTLQRALALADRELSPTAPESLSGQPTATVPPVGSLDLAVNAADLTADEIAGQVAERINVTGPESGRAREWLRRDRLTATIALLGVNRCADRADLLAFCGELAEQGCRLLLVFDGAGSRPRQDVADRLALRHRLGQLPGRLAALGSRAGKLNEAAERLAGVRRQDEAVARLWETLAGIRLAHDRTGEPAPERFAAPLSRLEERARGVERALAAEESAADLLFARRRAAREQFETYQLLAAQHGQTEDIALAVGREYGEARRALYGRYEPEAAGDALAAYVDAVRRALGWPPLPRADASREGHGGNDGAADGRDT
ncbi:S1 family peptidase [Streptomyces litchfieldiae]|uniref:Serine protease n=1 Tax=Streptomyces litchfieldiae TaxID=3075543 RepID=A0ABU2MJ83_9ACTN|nr:serine protease [Streptomyces sp. DSM 44938]MDT0341536.1 serine protease [Streptomyces sp. DSM 44938]